jgi:7-keto-8-aminopelargonate synthetase-like enzyme
MAAITALRRMPLFTAGTPMMPASVWAFLKSFPLHARQRALSRERIAQFSDMVADIPQVHNPFQLPVFLLRESTGIEKRLHDQGIMISSFGYPDPDSPPINRIIITAQHQPAQLEILQQQLHAAYSSVKTS